MKKTRNYGLLNALSMMFLPFVEWLEAKEKKEREAKEERQARRLPPPVFVPFPTLPYPYPTCDKTNEWAEFGMILHLNARGAELARRNPRPNYAALAFASLTPEQLAILDAQKLPEKRTNKIPTVPAIQPESKKPLKPSAPAFV
jgi:hypothetical protein